MPIGLGAFRRLAAAHTHIPVWREVHADLDTPITAFWKLREGDHSFLLESVEGGEQWARYTIMGSTPRAIFKARDDILVTERPGEPVVTERCDDPIGAVIDRYADSRPYRDPELPRFLGGLVGTMTYDGVRWFESIPNRHPLAADAQRWDAIFVETGLVLIWDNLKHRATLVFLVAIGDGADLDALWDEANAALDAAEARLKGPLPGIPRSPNSQPETVQASVSDRAFEAQVEEARAFISAGDIIQVVLSRRFDQPQAGLHPFLVYRTLRGLNPSPYMFYLELGVVSVVGASPEVLVRTTDDVVEVRPIAGTRRRGSTPEEDAELAVELLADPKERAEHVMLVDLGRNDVGRLSTVGSVRVVEQMVIERYSHVMHLVSHVEGQLRQDVARSPRAIVASTFPAGTLSGAPKIRAMEIVDALEPTRRGVYGGAVGTIGVDGAIDLCIAIRTMVAQDDVLSVQAGAGIVYDSQPQAEAEETRSKARAVLRAIDEARERFAPGGQS